MASRIAGITIEIGGNTAKLQKSLDGVNKKLKSTSSALKDVNKLLKLNPGNTELLTQKQKKLTEAITLTKERLEQLKKAQDSVQKGSAEWDALQREIIATEGDLKGLQAEMRNFGSVSAQQLKAVGGKLKEAGGKIEDVGRKLAGVSAGAAAIGAGLLKLGYSAVQSADDLNTLSKQTGISTDELQKMQYASDLVDVSLEDITGALRKMKAKMDPANESFAALGVSVVNADGSLRSATDVFYDSVKALSGISNETERDQIAMALFGKSADQLAGIIDDGGAALRKYGEEAENLGLIMSGDTLDALNKTNDTIDQLKAEMSGTMAQIGADVATVLAPALKTAAEFIGKITAKLRELTPEQTETILKIVGIISVVSPLIILGGKIVTGIGALISGFGAVSGFITATLIPAIGGLLPVIGSVLAAAAPFLIGGAIIAGIVAGVVYVVKHWEEIKAAAEELKEKVSKDAKKQARKLAKAGWMVSPGAIPLEKQLDKSFLMQYEFDENLFPKYIMAEAQSVGGNYDAAKTSAISLAITNLAAQIQTEVTALVENTVANNQLEAGDAASITETVMSSKNLISQSMGRTIPVVECYRDLKNGNKEVLVRLAYNGDMAKEAAKKAVRAELEKKGGKLHEELDKVLGF